VVVSSPERRSLAHCLLGQRFGWPDWCQKRGVASPTATHMPQTHPRGGASQSPPGHRSQKLPKWHSTERGDSKRILINSPSTRQIKRKYSRFCSADQCWHGACDWWSSHTFHPAKTDQGRFCNPKVQPQPLPAYQLPSSHSPIHIEGVKRAQTNGF